LVQPLTRTNRSQNRGRRFLREPLLHFALFGGLLFAAKLLVFPWVETRWGTAEPIHVSLPQQAQLRANWQRENYRPPNEKEFQAQLNLYLDEERLVREAFRLQIDRYDRVVRERLAANQKFLGTDTDSQTAIKTAYAINMPASDPVIRRRLIQKMRQLVQRPVRLSEEKIRDWYDLHPEAFQTQAHYQLEHLFFVERAAAETALTNIQKGSNVLEIQSSPWLGGENFKWTTPKELKRLLGTAVLQDIEATKAGDWLGPLQTRWGFHLFQRVEYSPPAVPAFKAVRTQAIAKAYAAHDAEQLKSYLERLARRYPVSLAKADSE